MGVPDQGGEGSLENSGATCEGFLFRRVGWSSYQMVDDCMVVYYKVNLDSDKYLLILNIKFMVENNF